MHQIEAILTAESKRRQQANSIQREYIETYLDKLEQTLNNTVHSQFQTLERRINMVDSVLTKVEQQFDQQDQQVSSMIS